MKDKEKHFKERIDCGQATIIEEVEITEKAVRKNEDNTGAMIGLLNQEIEELQKAKTIEEMAKEMCKVCKSIEETCYMKKQPCSLIRDEAKVLYEQNYRKIPEDSVVLSREEYESDLTAQYDVAYEKASKETAEKILSEIWHNNFKTIITIRNSCSKEDVENISKGILISIRNKLKEIATREGVEIKE